LQVGQVKINLGYYLHYLKAMKNLHRLILSVFTAFLLFTTALKAQTIVRLQQGRYTSIRGLSVVDDSVAWISGSAGHISITTDGGKTWKWQQVKGFEKADFRDIEAFSNKEAVIMSSGTPALILKTIDGGNSWQVKYNNPDSTYFLDAMDFDKPLHGLILGDPIKNKFLLLETNDGGETWRTFKNEPDAMPNEASFAASGTCLRVTDGIISIASGGSNARLITYLPKKISWKYVELPLIHGKSSQGAFSLAIGKNEGIIIGGDYMHDKMADSVVCLHSLPLVNKFNFSVKGPTGFQSCVEFVYNSTFIATGTSGSNITTDGGKTWAKIDDTSFNVCRRAKHGKLVLLAGNG
jgi:photosystem II stability/assembly factor-like uncharacterized protein